MEMQFSPEFEDKLRRAASESGRGPEQLVREIVEAYLSHDKWFRAEVQKRVGALMEIAGCLDNKGLATACCVQ